MRRVVTLLVLLAAAGGGSWVWWQKSLLPATTDSEDVVLVEIPSGTPAQIIGETLAERELIRSPQAWRLWTLWQRRVRKREGDFQAGTYAIDPAQPLPEIAEQIWAGDVQQQDIVIPEGWKREEMAAYFEEELGWFAAEEFLAATSQIPRDRFAWLPKDLPHVEGFLFPDTYFFPAGVAPSAEQVRDRLLTQFETTALPTYQAARDRDDYHGSLLDWVTLASIVEKEAVVASERGIIAGVFTNRLQDGMPLASDPTVEYGLGIVQTPDRPLLFSEVRQPSPYNTYLNPGLPPTPIASPGLASLEATLAPTPTEYLFFVARYDGTHVFSRTFADHTRAQQRIRRQRQQ
ncbi:MAG: endolytic transglycosylase MltG [Cyanobacteria bacterium J06641_5]